MVNINWSYAVIVTVSYAVVYCIVFFITSIVAARIVRIERKNRKKEKQNESIAPSSPSNKEKSKTNDDEKESKNATEIISKSDELSKAEDDGSNVQQDLAKRYKHKTVIYDKNPIKHWAKLIWSKKKVYWSLVPHIFDQATDIGVIVEYHYLYKNDVNVGSVNTFWLFWISLFILLLHRIVSTLTLYVLTRNPMDILYQMFDMLLVKAILVSYRLESTEPTNAQRYLGILEATFESAPQILVSMGFILKSADNNTNISPIIIISALFSLWSLSSRVISDDKSMLDRGNWKHIEFTYKRCPCINPRYVARAILWRFMEITSHIFLCTLIWINLGGLALIIIIGAESVYCIAVCFVAKTPDAMGNLMYLTYSSNETAKNNDIVELLLFVFYGYRVISSYIYLILVTIFCSVQFEADNVEEYETRYNNTIRNGLGFFMLIYCWITNCMWPCIAGYAFKNGREFGAPTRDLETLSYGQNWDDVLELLEFGVNPSKKEIREMIQWLFITWRPDNELDIMMAVFNQALERCPEALNLKDDRGRTPIMEAIRVGAFSNLKTIKLALFEHALQQNIDLTVTFGEQTLYELLEGKKMKDFKLKVFIDILEKHCKNAGKGDCAKRHGLDNQPETFVCNVCGKRTDEINGCMECKYFECNNCNPLKGDINGE